MEYRMLHIFCQLSKYKRGERNRGNYWFYPERRDDGKGFTLQLEKPMDRKSHVNIPGNTTGFAFHDPKTGNGFGLATPAFWVYH